LNIFEYFFVFIYRRRRKKTQATMLSLLKLEEDTQPGEDICGVKRRKKKGEVYLIFSNL